METQKINNKNIKVLCTQGNVPKGAEQLERIVSQSINQRFNSKDNVYYSVSIDFNSDLESAKDLADNYDAILCGYSKCSNDFHEDSEKNAEFIKSLIEKQITFNYFDNGEHFGFDLEHMLPFIGMCPYEQLKSLRNKGIASSHKELVNLGRFYLGPNSVDSYAKVIADLVEYLHNENKVEEEK